MKFANLLKCLILAVLQRIVLGLCSLTYYAEEISYQRASLIDVYYTTTEASSVAECALFCGKRQFCRTAIFNTISETCSISYNYVISCRGKLQQDQLNYAAVQSHLILIACVDSCFNSTKDGLRIQTEANPSEWSLLNLIRNNHPDLEVPYTDQYEETEEWIANRLRNSNLKNIQNDDSQDGYWNKIIVEGIRRYLTEVNAAQKNIKKTPELVSKNTHSNIAQCFDIVKRQSLLNAGFEIYKNISFESCRCACVKTWLRNDTVPLCRSFQYNEFNECLLNRADHHSKFDLVYDLTARYYYINCSATEFSERLKHSCETFDNKAESTETDASFKHTFSSLFPMPKSGLFPEVIATENINKKNVALRREVSDVDDLTTQDAEISAEKLSAETIVPLKKQEKESGQEPGKAKAMASFPPNEILINRKNEDLGISIKNDQNNIMEKEFVDEPIKEAKNDRTLQRIDENLKLASGVGKEKTDETSSPETVQNKGNLVDDDGNKRENNLKSEEEKVKDPKSRLIFEPLKKFVPEVTTTSTINVTSIITVREDAIAEKEEITTTTFRTNSEEIAELISQPTTETLTFPTTIAKPFKSGKTSEATPSGREDESVNDISNENRKPEEIRVDNNLKKLQSNIETAETFKQVSNSVVDNETNAVNLPNVSKSCFEVIDGFAMKGIAGGLEHNVSVEECQCICANSRNSGAFAFQCESATYYHKERDCVLNLENRQQRSELFGENIKKEYEVSYIGMTCSPEETLQRFVDLKINCALPNQNIITTEVPKEETTTTTTFTDECYFELPDFVLEGTALAVEGNVTVAQCKCFCTDSKNRYGDICLSLEYYYDSQTCLLNTENRLTNTNRFKYIPGITMTYSYFDYQCATKKIPSERYSKKCRDQLILPSKLKSATDVLSENVDADSKDLNSNGKHAVKKTPKIQDDHSKIGQKLENLKKWSDEDELIEKKVKSLLEKAKRKYFLEGKLLAEKNKLRYRQRNINSDNNSNDKVSKHETTAITASKDEKPIKTTTLSASNGVVSPTETTTTKIPALITTLIPKTTKTTTSKPGGDVNESDKSDKSSNKSVKPTNKTTNANETRNGTTKTTTTQEPTTTYSPVGRCTYSALYQTFFRGTKMIKRFLVDSPSQCFAGCYHERCRSVNLIKTSGVTKYCELYKDTLIDYRTSNILGYDSTSAYFYGIQCNGETR